MTLSSMKQGQKGKISKLSGDNSLIQRLSCMGITLGEEIKLIGQSPFHGPLIIKTLDTVLALRLSEAGTISVDLNGE